MPKSIIDVGLDVHLDTITSHRLERACEEQRVSVRRFPIHLPHQYQRRALARTTKRARQPWLKVSHDDVDDGLPVTRPVTMCRDARAACLG